MSVIGVGVDIEAVKSFRDKKWPKDRRFFARIFSPHEIRYCRKFADPAPHFAARFCAKEALVKAASPVVALFVSDMEVTHHKNGTPQFMPRLHRVAAEKFFKKYTTWLSISHTKDQAIAFVVVGLKDAD